MVQIILRRRDVERATGLSRSTLYALMADGKFPRPIRLSLRAVGWLESDLQEWQAARAAKRDAPTAAGKQRRTPNPS